MKSEYIECSCSTPEHTIRFIYEEDVHIKDTVYLCVFLQHFPFFKRIWIAIKYIFGYKCIYGHFDEAVLNKEGIDKLRNFLEKIKTNE